jgi:hypothetical protein
VNGPTHGTLVLDAAGAFTYTPEAHFIGTDAFTYKANDGALDSQPATVVITVGTASLHIGDLDGIGRNLSRRSWRATVIVAVHNLDHVPVRDARVRGTWSAGTRIGSTLRCVTNRSGQCAVKSGLLSRSTDASASFTIVDIAGALPYLAGANHDPDASSNGTSITVNKP